MNQKMFRRDSLAYCGFPSQLVIEATDLYGSKNFFESHDRWSKGLKRLLKPLPSFDFLIKPKIIFSLIILYL